jgi:hypothetical protein
VALTAAPTHSGRGTGLSTTCVLETCMTRQASAVLQITPVGNGLIARGGKRPESGRAAQMMILRSPPAASPVWESAYVARRPGVLPRPICAIRDETVMAQMDGAPEEIRALTHALFAVFAENDR